MLRKRLFTPGPTSVPESVLLEMAQPIIHHRTDEFIAIAAQVFQDLKYVFQTEGDVFVMAASGTGAMEASVVNLLSPGEKMITVSGGKFGERWAEIGQAYGLGTIVLDVPWGKKFEVARLEKALKDNPGVRAVYATLCETSTGTHFDIEAMGKVVAQYPETALVIDTISSLGAVPCRTDQWNLDMVVTGSQKALMLPPGLAFISVSKKAWTLIEQSKLPKYYFNLKKYKKVLEKNDFPFTMAVSLVIGLKKSLELIKGMGIENVWQEHHKRAEATRRGLGKMGLKLFSESPSDGVTAVVLPDGVDGEKLCKLLRVKYGLSMAGGQDKVKGKIIRVSHLGWQDDFDALTAISAIGVGLAELGCKVPTEAGLAEAHTVLFG